MQYDMNQIVGQTDIIFITLDTLRYDVAQACWQEGLLPNFTTWLSPNGWEKRHSPGSFTYAAHHAFFAGFLPTPFDNPAHPRLFATQFAGSTTTQTTTFSTTESNMVQGLEKVGYQTVCIGGVGFFNKQTALSNVFPSLFMESYWEVDYGVTNPDSSQCQFQKAASVLAETQQNIFLFINISALHQPNYFYLNPNDSEKKDTLKSHSAALQYIDSQLPILQEALAKREQAAFVICCGDHGTTYGEEGYWGHRLAHPMVWNVPYLETLIE